jgi:hypothetical protein
MPLHTPHEGLQTLPPRSRLILRLAARILVEFMLPLATLTHANMPGTSDNPKLEA